MTQLLNNPTDSQCSSTVIEGIRAELVKADHALLTVRAEDYHQYIQMLTTARVIRNLLEQAERTHGRFFKV